MTRLQLRIRTPWLDIQPDPEDPDQNPPPAEAVYEAEIVAGDVSADTAAQAGVIETGDVPVRIVSAELAGAASLLALRPERLRAAVVEAGSGEIVLDGTVERVGVRCDEPSEGDDLRLWDVLVRETAREDLEAALPGVSCRALVPALTALNDVVGLPVRIHDGDGNLHSETWGWTDLRSLVEQTLRAAGAAGATVPVPQLGIYYQDGADVRVARVPVRLAVATARGLTPSWTGEDAWGIWQGLMGARLDASYGDYPSTQIYAAALDGRWSEPDVLPPAYEPVDGYELSADPAEAPGFRLALGRALYNVLDGYVPPAAAYEAGGAGEPEEVAVLVPRVLASGTVAYGLGGYSETQTVGYPIIDRVADEVGPPKPGQGDPADDKVYLVAIVETPAGNRALAYRAIDNPPSPFYGPARANETWAASLFSNHQMRAWETFTARLEIDVDGAAAAGLPVPSVGEAEQGIAIEGLAWAVSEFSYDVHRGTAAVTAIRPSRALSDPYATSGAVSPGVYPEPTIAAFIRSEQAEGQAGPEGPIMFYAAGYAGAAGADSVEMQMLGGGAWTAYVEGTRVNVIDASDHRFFRARAVYAVYGVTTGWVYAGTDGSTTPPAGAPA